MKKRKTKFNKIAIEKALIAAKGSKIHASELLACSRPTLDKCNSSALKLHRKKLAYSYA